MADPIPNPGTPVDPAAPAAPTTGGAAPTLAAPSPTPAPAPTDWTSNLPEDMKALVAVKKFADPGQVLKSYKELEAYMGVPADRIIKIPAPTDDPKLLNDVYTKLGRPEKPEEYKIPVPKAGLSPEQTAFTQKLFHEAGINQRQAELIAGKWNAEQERLIEAAATANETQNELEATQLKTKWGAAYEQNLNQAKAAMKEFGITEAMVDKIESSMGFNGVMDLFHKIGSKLGESSYVDGNKSRSVGKLAPEMAQTAIENLKKDQAWTKKYLAGDPEAKAEFSRLHEMAYPNKDSA